MTEQPPLHLEKAVPEPRMQVGMMLLPHLTALDLIGPHMALEIVSDVHLVWKTLDPVYSDQGVGILPTATFETCPEDLDILFVPGGASMLPAVQDDELLDFLADRGSRAKWVTSDCTGSIVLAAAGLLGGYRAATHWASREILARTDVAEVVIDERVVFDRNRVTGGGATAGIDFALKLIDHIYGPQLAKTVQLGMEYDPEPPYDAGTPERPDTEPEGLATMRQATAPLNEATIAAVEMARERRAVARAAS